MARKSGIHVPGLEPACCTFGRGDVVIADECAFVLLSCIALGSGLRVVRFRERDWVLVRVCGFGFGLCVSLPWRVMRGMYSLFVYCCWDQGLPCCILVLLSLSLCLMHVMYRSAVDDGL